MNRRAVVVVACMGGLLGGLDTSVNIAFPDITASFDIDVAQIQWVVVSFVLTYSVLLLPAGRLGDRYGHGRVMLIGTVTQIFAFVACAASPSFGLFLISRVLQGVAMALILGTSPALVTLSVSHEKQPRALGLYAMFSATGLAMGAPIGGLLLLKWGWPSVYLFRVPYSVLLLFAALSCGLARRPKEQNEQPLDLAGALTLALGLGLTLFVASRGLDWGWFAPVTIALIATAAIVLFVFVIIERKADQPLIDIALFRIAGFARANVLNALANASMFSIWFLGPYLLVDVRGQDSIEGGLLLGTTPTFTALAAWLAGKYVTKFGLLGLSRFGLFSQGLGLLLFSRAGAETSTLFLVVALAIVGIGLGSFQVPNMSFVMGSIPRSQQGVAGGMTQMTRTAGLVAGLAIWNTAFVGLRKRRSDALGIEELTAPEVFVPTFAEVVGLSGLLAMIGLTLTMGTTFDNKLKLPVER